MSIQRKQHYVPESYLIYFADEKSKFVFMINKY